MASFFTKPTTANPTTPTTQEQGPTLAELESVIAAGLDTVEQVGRALLQIKMRKLFLDTHANWEDYLEARWKMSHAYAQRLIEAAAVIGDIRSAGLPIPTREAHARELRKVPTNKRPEAWSQTLAAVGGNPDNVTAELVASVASKHRTKKARRKAPKTIVVRGRGWTVKLSRNSINVDPVAALNEALAKLTATSSTTTKAA